MRSFFDLTPDELFREYYNLPVPPADDFHYAVNRMGLGLFGEGGIYWEEIPEIPIFLNTLPRHYK